MAELLGNDVPASTVQRLWLRVHAVRRGRACSNQALALFQNCFTKAAAALHAQDCFHHMQVPLPLVSVETVMQGTASVQSCFVSGTVCAATSVGCCTSLRLLLCPFCDTQQAVLPGRALPACTGTCMHHACIVVVTAVHQETCGELCAGVKSRQCCQEAGEHAYALKEWEEDVSSRKQHLVLDPDKMYCCCH